MQSFRCLQNKLNMVVNTTDPGMSVASTCKHTPKPLEQRGGGVLEVIHISLRNIYEWMQWLTDIHSVSRFETVCKKQPVEWGRAEHRLEGLWVSHSVRSDVDKVTPLNSCSDVIRSMVLWVVNIHQRVKGQWHQHAYLTLHLIRKHENKETPLLFFFVVCASAIISVLKCKIILLFTSCFSVQIKYLY